MGFSLEGEPEYWLKLDDLAYDIRKNAGSNGGTPYWYQCLPGRNDFGPEC